MIARRFSVRYLAGPYAPKPGITTAENIRRAQVVAGALVAQGYNLIVPHTMSIGLESAMSEEEWIEHGLMVLSVCDGIILLPGWEKSYGTMRELDAARSNNKLIGYVRPHNEWGWFVESGCKVEPWPAGL